MLPNVELWEAIALSLDIDPSPGLCRALERPAYGHRLSELGSAIADRLTFCQRAVSTNGPIRPQGALYVGVLQSMRCKVLLEEVASFLTEAGERVPDQMRVKSTVATADEVSAPNDDTTGVDPIDWEYSFVIGELRQASPPPGSVEALLLELLDSMYRNEAVPLAAAIEVGGRRFPVRSGVQHEIALLPNAANCLLDLVRPKSVDPFEGDSVIASSAAKVIEEEKGQAPEQGTSRSTKFSVARSELVSRYTSRWPTIARDLRDASTNGLSKAKAGVRDWDEALALEWAKSRGKLKGAEQQAEDLGDAMRRLTSLPRTVHRVGDD